MTPQNARAGWFVMVGGCLVLSPSSQAERERCFPSLSRQNGESTQAAMLANQSALRQCAVSAGCQRKRAKLGKCINRKGLNS